MKKRLIDIYPPHDGLMPLSEEEARLDDGRKTSSATNSNARLPLGRFGGLLACSVLLLVTAPFAVHIFFARASVQAWPHITKLHMSEWLIAQIGADSVNLEKRIIRARMFQEDIEQSLLFPASGTKFKEEKARGVIRVYNENTAGPQALVANTRFISEDGKIFRLETAASVPAARMDGRRVVPGSLDVQASGAEAGEEYNIGVSKFSLPGLVGSPSYTKVYGESLEPMAGGMKRTVAVATEEDIAKAHAQLTETLKAQATKSLLAKVPPQFQVLADSLTTVLLVDNSLVKPGAELEQFTYTAKMRASMVGFHKEDADLLSRHLLFAQLGSNYALNENTLYLAYSMRGKAGESGVLPIEVQIGADRYEKVDAAGLANRLRGVSESQFGQLLKEYPFLAKTKISLWPFWISRAPADLEKISIEVLLES